MHLTTIWAMPYNMDKKVQVCREWEATARQVNQENVRLVLLRIGVVLGKDGGALGRWVLFHSICLFPFPFFLGPFQFVLLHYFHLIYLSICSKDDPPFHDVCRWSYWDRTPMVVSLSLPVNSVSIQTDGFD